MSDALFPPVTRAPVTRAQWQVQAERELRGRPLSALTRTNADGIATLPVYLREDFADAPGRAGLGTRATQRWRSIQEYRHADPQAANAAARRDLDLGADGLWFFVDSELRAGREPGAPPEGLVCDPFDDLDTLLAGIDPARTSVFIDAGLLAPAWADALEAWIDEHDQRDSGDSSSHAELGRGPARGGVIYDPFTPLAQTGSLESGFESALTELVDAMLGRTVGLIGVSTCPYHDAGASDAHELALALSTCAELLRRGESLGLEPEDLAPSLIWTVAIAGRPFEAIAKLRAVRLCWAKFASACGLGSGSNLWIHATSSQRTWTRHAPWVNLLRGTVGTFAAALGGADSIATAAFDGLCGPEGAEVDGLGRGSELGRRLALNTQLILRDESGLDRSVDPAGGSHYVEALTDALARAAWQKFRAIEGSGGLVANLSSGAVQRTIAASAEALRERAATRKQALTGLSSYPIHADEPTPAQPANTFAGDGPDLQRTSPVLDPAEVAKLPRLRLAAPFERLRDASEAWAKQHGGRPSIYSLNLGALALHQPRAEFAANLFAAGGLAVVGSEGFDDVDSAIAGVRQSGCKAVVVCGRDQDYAALVSPLLAELRAAGVQKVWIAGRPPDDGWGLDPKRLPEFIFVGGDALAACELALRTLGVIDGDADDDDKKGEG